MKIVTTTNVIVDGVKKGLGRHAAGALCMTQEPVPSRPL